MLTLFSLISENGAQDRNGQEVGRVSIPNAKGCCSGLRDLIIIADDLTGACDAAVAFAGCAPVHVCVEGHPDEREGVWAIDTASRDMTCGDAEALLARVSARVPKHKTVFKKIDSVFRGNTFVEIAAICRCLPADIVVIAPAYPALGRMVKQGRLRVEYAGKSGQIDVKEGLQACGCNPAMLEVSSSPEALSHAMQNLMTAGKRIVLCDAWEQDHLNMLAGAVSELSTHVLWIGSGGLACAIANQWAPEPNAEEVPLPRGRTVFCVGSDHSVTKEQSSFLRLTTDVPVYSCSASAMPAQSSFLLDISSRTTAGEVRAALSAVSPRETACLFFTGGDTARLVCGALGISSLRLLREFAPGVPLGLAEGGAFDGIPVVLKSGGFGDRDLLLHIMRAFSGEERGNA